MKKENLTVEEVQIIDGIKKTVVIGVLENVDIPETKDDLARWADSYVVDKFTYGLKVDLRSAFKRGLSGNSRRDKDARNLGFENYDDMVQQIKAMKAAGFGK